MTNDVIASDHPLSPSQQMKLPALLDTVLPESIDAGMPSAEKLDFVGYLDDQAEDFAPQLAEVLENFDDEFSGLSPTDRYPLVVTFSEAQPELFDALLFHIYNCYYQQDRVLEGIGLSAGPPFPKGRSVDAGDLSLLDPVIAGSQTYRK